MVPFVQACSDQECKPHQCRQAMGHFYSTLPHNRAETLVFCECDRDDQECQQMKDSLLSGSCETDESEAPWTCLEVLDSCSGDILCRLVSNLLVFYEVPNFSLFVWICMISVVHFSKVCCHASDVRFRGRVGVGTSVLLSRTFLYEWIHTN